MAHDDYYAHLQKNADEQLQKASHALHKAMDCKERFEQFAHVVGVRFADAIEAYLDALMAHHELHENKA